MSAILRLFIVVMLAGSTLVCGGGLIVEQVPAALLRETNTVAFTAIPAAPVTIIGATTNRWGKFQTEFGIQQPSQSLVKGALQNAKYQLDQTSLELQAFVETITDRLRFDYRLSDLGVQVFFLGTTISEARLKSEINLKLGESAFVGVKLVLPIGN